MKIKESILRNIIKEEILKEKISAKVDIMKNWKKEIGSLKIQNNDIKKALNLSNKDIEKKEYEKIIKLNNDRIKNLTGVIDKINLYIQEMKEQIYNKDGTGPHGKGLGPGKGKGCDKEKDVKTEARSNAKNPGKFFTMPKSSIKPIKNPKITKDEIEKLRKEYIKMKKSSNGSSIISFNQYVDSYVKSKK